VIWHTICLKRPGNRPADFRFDRPERPADSAEKSIAGPHRPAETREIRLTAPDFATDI
jgi:hypothetical protein